MVGGVTARSRHHEHKLAETVRHHSAASQEHVKPSDEAVGRNRKVVSTYAYAIFTGDGVRGLPVPGGERGQQCGVTMDRRGRLFMLVSFEFIGEW